MAGPELLAVDSWLVRDGRVRALDRHRERFRRACIDALGNEPAEFAAFWTATVNDLPRTGSCWPRVELHQDGTLTAQHRPAPLPTSRVSLSLAPDPRRHPTRKGADLGPLASLRDERGTEEVLLTSPDGTLLEGTSTSLLWWDGDVLCRPGPDLPILVGITSDLIAEAAAAQGISVLDRHARAGELDGREVWLVNAVRGIRLPEGSPASDRATHWQAWLDEQVEDLPQGARTPAKTSSRRTVKPSRR